MDRIPVYFTVQEMTMLVGALRFWWANPFLPGGFRLADELRKDLADLAGRLTELQDLEYPVA